MTVLNAICVFCGSSAGTNPAYVEAAQATGRLLAEKGITLVYGGGRVGLMGAVADAAIEAGGAVHGVIPEALRARELAHQSLTRLDVVGSMHERKARMAELSDAFVALPGGAGTLEEIAEIWTWAQLGIHAKPIGFLNVEGYYDPLFAFIDQGVAEGFITPMSAGLLLRRNEPKAMLDALSEAIPAPMDRWLRRVKS